MSQAFAIPSVASGEKPPVLSDELSSLLDSRVSSILMDTCGLDDIAMRAYFVDQDDPNPRLTQMVSSAILCVWWDLFGMPNRFEYTLNFSDIAVKPYRLVNLNTVLSSVSRNVPSAGDHQNQQSAAAKLSELIIQNLHKLTNSDVVLIQFNDSLGTNYKTMSLRAYSQEIIENTDSWYFMVMAP